MQNLLEETGNGRFRLRGRWGVVSCTSICACFTRFKAFSAPCMQLFLRLHQPFGHLHEDDLHDINSATVSSQL